MGSLESRVHDDMRTPTQNLRVSFSSAIGNPMSMWETAEIAQNLYDAIWKGAEDKNSGFHFRDDITDEEVVQRLEAAIKKMDGSRGLFETGYNKGIYETDSDEYHAYLRKLICSVVEDGVLPQDNSYNDSARAYAVSIGLSNITYAARDINELAQKHAAEMGKKIAESGFMKRADKLQP